MTLDRTAILRNAQKLLRIGKLAPAIKLYEQLVREAPEDLQTSVEVLARRLGFPPVVVERLNTSVHDEEVTAEMREEFVAQHPLEYAIYNYAVSHYKP